MRSWKRPRQEIDFCCVAGDRLLIGWAGPGSRRRLVAYQSDQELYDVEGARFAVDLAWIPETGLVCELRIDGLGLLDPREGKRLLNFLPRSSLAQATKPAYRDGILYIWTYAGVLWAIRHPR